MINLQNLNTFLLLFLIGSVSALFHSIVLKRYFAGRLLAAMLIGLLGSYLGYFLSTLPMGAGIGGMKMLSLLAALVLSQGLLFLLGILSSVKDWEN